MLQSLLNGVGSLVVKRSGRLQQARALRDLGLWGLERNSRGHLSIDGADACDLVERFGSPLFVVNESRLVRDVRGVRQAFASAPAGSRILFSYKTNCVPGLLRSIHGLGIGAEVISPYELWLAESLGVPGDDVVYNGVSKSRESLERAARMNVLAVNIDSLDEIDRLLDVATRLGRKLRVGLRLGLRADCQFGLNVAGGAALEAARRIAARPDRFELNCMHFHHVASAWEVGAHRELTRRALDAVRAIRDATGLEAPYLDIGGGFGVPTTRVMTRREYAVYRLFEAPPSPPRPERFMPLGRYLPALFEYVHDYCHDHGLTMPRIIIEPGRAIASRAELLLTAVHAIKDQGQSTPFALTDAGRLSLTYPCDYEYHEILVAGKPEGPLTHRYHLTGRVCTTADWIARNRCLPRLEQGDVLAIMDAGAYFHSCSSNFAFPRPAVVAVRNGRERTLCAAESFEHLTATDSAALAAAARGSGHALRKQAEIRAS